MPCGHVNRWNIHTYLLHLEESSSGAHVLIQVLSGPFGQHWGLVDITNHDNVVSALLVDLVPVGLVQVGLGQGGQVQVGLVQMGLILFYMHWLKWTSNSGIHT